MEILFIGGTGVISTACVSEALDAGHDVWVLNRGLSRLPNHVGAERTLIADASDESQVRDALGSRRFDVVIQWTAYVPRQVELDLRLYADAGQYVFISSASAYEKPPSNWLITERTPLLGRSEAIGEDFHITSDEALTWNQIYLLVAKATDVELDVLHVPSDAFVAAEPAQLGNLWGDKANSAVFDNSKLRSIVPGFKAVVPFEQGIQEAVDWFDADPSRQEIDEGANALWDRLAIIYGEALARAATSSV
jgi:nucleoside-diphosphate-sugar epimerase